MFPPISNSNSVSGSFSFAHPSMLELSNSQVVMQIKRIAIGIFSSIQDILESIQIRRSNLDLKTTATIGCVSLITLLIILTVYQLAFAQPTPQDSPNPRKQRTYSNLHVSGHRNSLTRKIKDRTGSFTSSS